MRQGAHQQFARALRREMTDAERLLWLHLRRKQLAGFRFRRQYSIGPYIADFVCLEAKLVVEVDGGQHVQSLQDEDRDNLLSELGFRVVRFWNSDMLNDVGRVLAEILRVLASNSPLPPSGPLPPHAGEGDQERSLRTAPFRPAGTFPRVAEEGSQERAGEGHQERVGERK